MLYGSKTFREGLMKCVNRIEDRKCFKTIFGSTIGSISKGTERYSSDYDVRFLYVDKMYRLLDKHDRHTEDKIRYRVFSKSKSYNCIAFWEVSAFLNFLCEPYIDNDMQYKLVRNVLHTFLSPYQYDPFGISFKILPILNKIINLEYEIKYHYDILTRFIAIGRNNVMIFQYFNAVHAYLSLKWIKDESSLPPMYIITLLTIADDELNSEVHSILEMNQKEQDKNIDYVKIKVGKSIVEQIEDIIKGTLFNEIDMRKEFKKNEKHVNDMLEIIQHELEFFEGG